MTAGQMREASFSWMIVTACRIGNCDRVRDEMQTRLKVESGRWLKASSPGALILGLLLILGMPAAAEHQQSRNVVPISSKGTSFALENQAIGARLRFVDGRISGLTIRDRLRGTDLGVSEAFRILLADGTVLDARTLRLTGTAKLVHIQPDVRSPRSASALSGEEVEAQFETDDHSVGVQWSLVVLSGTSYLRQVVRIVGQGEKDVPINRVELIDMSLPGAHVVGSVAGSPIVAGDLFAGFEHPLAQTKVTGSRAQAWIERELPLKAGQTVTYSSVIGVAREGQIRRDFLIYLERERAHPYRTFLHYNSWYDLGYFTPYASPDAVNRINAFGHELTEKRGVRLDSFLFDDGWDRHDSLWKFNSGFPDGFTSVRQAAEKFGADPGVWMSPWGGYSKPKQERIAFGKSAGFEIVSGGYALSGPKYYEAFKNVALEMIQKYGVNQFKFDGTGNADLVFPGSRFDSDFSAMIHLIEELRAAKPDLFVNLTTGTWPSPFWVMHADSIWRGGDDDNYAGVGSYRERWITYRDAQTYRNVVQMGPLYPLNSLMLHGIIYAREHKELNTDPGSDFRNEVRSYFGTGTQLQEMYITPGLLSEQNWDDLAEAAKWSRENQGVLKDTHWVGGDPAWLEVYGWAAWTPEKATLVLRNPSDHEQVIRLRLRDALELPPDAVKVYSARSPWKEDAGRPAIVLSAQEAHEFHLAAFQVLTLDILPTGRVDRQGSAHR